MRETKRGPNEDTGSVDPLTAITVIALFAMTILIGRLQRTL